MALKTITPVEWANTTNYPADASGDPWRTGSSPTKVIPPTSFTTEGLVPGDRYAAQWENYYKNQTGVQLKEAATEQLSRFVRQNVVSRLSWNWVSKVWLHTQSTSAYSVDRLGQPFGQTFVITDVGTPNRSIPSKFGTESAVIWRTTGNTATSFRLTLGSESGAPTVGAMTAGSALVFGSGNGINTSDSPTTGLSGATLAAGTAGGVSAIFGVNPSFNTAWVTYALPAAAVPITSTKGFFFMDPITFDVYLMASVGANTVLYKQLTRVSGEPGTWSLVYNSTSLFANSTMTTPPMYDPVADQWVFIVDFTTTRALSDNAARYKTRTYRAPRTAPQTVTLDKTTTGIAVHHLEDLGNGKGVGFCARRRMDGASGGAHQVMTEVCTTTDYGATWRLTGELVSQDTIADTAAPALAPNISIYSTAESTVLVSDGLTTAATLGLRRPGGDQIILTGV